MVRRPFSRCFLLAALAAALWGPGCASAPDKKPAPEVPSERQDELVEAERLYRARDPGFAAVRDRLAADPVTAYWLTRLFVYDVIRIRDQERADDAAFLASVVDVKRDRYDVPLEQLRAMGPAAVPALVEDLLRSKYSDRRQLGAEILVEMGPQVIPALMPLMAEDDWHVRRLAVQVAGGMSADPVDTATLTLLEQGATDEHFAVRGLALTSLLRYGDDQVDRARRALAGREDDYVKRVVAEALGACPDRATAEVLVAYLADCIDRGDRRGVAIADASLQQISGYGRSRNLESWKAWLISYSPQEKR